MKATNVYQSPSFLYEYQTAVRRQVFAKDNVKYYTCYGNRAYLRRRVETLHYVCLVNASHCKTFLAQFPGFRGTFVYVEADCSLGDVPCKSVQLTDVRIRSRFWYPTLEKIKKTHTE